MTALLFTEIPTLSVDVGVGGLLMRAAAYSSQLIAFLYKRFT